MASKIAEKKTARQVKDLQEQLQRERALRGTKSTPSVENLAAVGSKGSSKKYVKPLTDVMMILLVI